MSEVDSASSRMVSNLTDKLIDLSALTVYTAENGYCENKELNCAKRFIQLAIRAHNNILILNRQQYNKLFNLSGRLLLYGQ